MKDSSSTNDRSNEGLGTTVVKRYPIRGPINSVTPPIIASSTFLLDSVDHGAHLSRERIYDGSGWFYSRWGNPTTDIAARIMNSLEYAYGTLITSSGMAAISTVFVSLLEAGDHIIVPYSLYGGTHEFLTTIGKRMGFETTFIQGRDTKEYKDAIQENTRVIYAETPANPTMKLTNLEQVARIARDTGSISVVDSTFASPVNQQPIKLGMDIVVHSATKYLGGHADILAGTISVNSKSLFERCYHSLKLLGGNLSPFDAFLLIRGIKTLEVRIRRHNENAMRIAQFLEHHPKIARVFYPGLRSHPDYELATQQMVGGYGGMLSFEVKGGIVKGRTVVESLRVCSLAVSLGGVETLVEHPATMTHSMVPRTQRERAGITDGLIRLSVGIENVDDLISDLDQALNAA
ncbi:MAG: trans-sulfuration enzyme family protein [Candidatus Thorarchaeota archaeon]